MSKDKFSAPVLAILIILVLCISTLIYTSNITGISLSQKTYDKHFEKNDIYSRFNSSVDLSEEAGHLIAYLKDGEPLTGDFYNAKEKAHMVDVKDIFDSIMKIITIAAIISLLALIALFFAIRPEYARRSGRAADKYLERTLTSLLIWTGAVVDGAAVLFGIIALTFSGSFIWFHKIFFDNDLWILNPETDNLIRMLPEVFFYETFIRIILMSVLFATLLLVVGFIIRLGKPRWMNKEKV